MLTYLYPNRNTMEVTLGMDQRPICKQMANKPRTSRRKINGHRGDPHYGRARQPVEEPPRPAIKPEAINLTEEA